MVNAPKKNLSMKKVKITQVRSIIGRPERQKRTMAALGLRKMHQTVEHEQSPQVMGMIIKVRHLVRVEEV
ncbi:MAG: 50S ribosomal protein L30 [Bacteroidia bacterium]|nr:50S ribosomal protein L30 [Bacteroidia bacterium]